MSLLDTFEKLRKAPLPVRQRFVGIATITVMAVTAFVWLLFFSWTITHTNFSFPIPGSDTEKTLLPPYDE